MRKVDTPDVHTDSAPYSNCIVHDDIIYIAGQDPDNDDGVLVSDDIKEQTIQTLENIERILKNANASLSDIVSVDVYLVDMNDFDEFNEAYEKVLPNPKPARTTIAVDALATEARIEISATAVNNNSN